MLHTLVNCVIHDMPNLVKLGFYIKSICSVELQKVNSSQELTSEGLKNIFTHDDDLKGLL